MKNPPREPLAGEVTGASRRAEQARWLPPVPWEAVSPGDPQGALPQAPVLGRSPQRSRSTLGVVTGRLTSLVHRTERETKQNGVPKTTDFQAQLNHTGVLAA